MKKRWKERLWLGFTVTATFFFGRSASSYDDDGDDNHDCDYDFDYDYDYIFIEKSDHVKSDHHAISPPRGDFFIKKSPPR